MASEKIDALELDINAKLTSDNLDKLIDALNKLSKAIDKVNAKKLNQEVKETGDNASTASVKVDGLTDSFLNQTIRITALISVYKKLYSTISDSLESSMSYIKTLNMFTVSLGDYADNASKYGNTVREALGIDYAGWQKAQGIFQTLIEGFGVGGDQAAYMSQQLTQLSYDIASYYDLTTEEAQNKVKAALSGRIEPIRKLGWDISQGKLVDIAANPENYGVTTYSINQETGAIEANTQAVDDNTEHKIVNFNQLTQQEKVQLRYIALMTQVTEVQGNMGKTLHDPAMQMKIFKEQTAMTARALGNIFIPAINEVLPYLTAFANLLEETFQDIARFFGFEIPDMSDRIGVEDEVEYYDDIVEATGSAAKNAKKIKDYMIGIDELNVLRPDDTGTGGGGSATGEQSNLNNLLIPGYDFLSSAIENRVKEAKATIEGFIDYLKGLGTLESIGFFAWEGLGTIGEGFWTWVLGKTPEELAEEAKINGRTIGQQFWVSLRDGNVGEIGESFWEWATGKTEDELAQDAWDSGQTVRMAFLTSLATNSFPAQSMGKGISAWETVLGLDENLEERAQKAGRTIGEQFAIECGKALAKLGTQNPFFEWLYEVTTGRNAQEDLEAFERATYKSTPTTQSPYDVRNTLGIDSSMPGTSNGKVYQRDNAATIEAAKHGKAVAKAYSESVQNTYKATDNAAVIEAQKHGEAVAKAYAEGVAKNRQTLAQTGNAIYQTLWNGAYHYGQAPISFYNASSNVAKKYNDGLKTGVSGAAQAGQSLYESGYNGASNYGYGGYEYSNLADNFARLFANALGSNSALSGSYNSGYKLANEGTWGAYDLNSEFEYVGDMAGQGYVLGIRKNEYKAEYAGSTVANATLYKLKEALGIASPSKETYEAGKFFDEGFANAIRDYTGIATDASENVARMSVLAMKTSSSMFNSGVSVPTTSNTGYSMGVMNEGAMASLASNIYQAVVSGMSVASNGTGGDIKVIIDGKEVFKVVQKEQRDRGVAISNGAFSR